MPLLYALINHSGPMLPPMASGEATGAFEGSGKSGVPKGERMGVAGMCLIRIAVLGQSKEIKKPLKGLYIEDKVNSKEAKHHNHVREAVDLADDACCYKGKSCRPTGKEIIKIYFKQEGL